MSESTSTIELIPIDSQTRTIQTCFQQCLYMVPNFQRPYSWSQEQLEDYWQDVILALGDFFFGSTVTWVSEKRDLFNDTYSIIDGQQRLTTSAIVLSVIRDAFHTLGDALEKVDEASAATASSQANATQKYLIASDDDGKSYAILTRPEEMFYEVIQNPSAIPSGVTWNGSAKRIGEARAFFEARVMNDLGNYPLKERIERLKYIRANVLKARIIQVELTSEEDGFLIFETLNTRGADLRLSDLVKNLLIRGGASDVNDRKAIALRWDRVIDSIQEGRTSTDVVDRFIWQSWNSRRDAVREPELFKEIGRLVSSDPGAHLSYLNELESDSATYEWLEAEHVPVQQVRRGVRKALAVPEFVDSIRALAIFNVSVANSTILAAARKYQETRLVTQSQLIEVMLMVENFHFQFTALTNSGSTGGTRGRYNRFAVLLEKAQSRAEVSEAISDLRARLQQSLPDQARVAKSFRELFYAPALRLNQAQKVRSRKIFIAYVLMAFAKSNKLIPAGQNLESWSIEHIKPQSKGSEDRKDPVYSIGNLALLTNALNNDLGNSPLSEKLLALKIGSAYFDSQLESWLSETGFPSDAQILERAGLLAREALDQVWIL